jgi:beta-lactamase regulating signal transducer with metallopeptidase domain
METLNNVIVLLNHWGPTYCDFAGRMLIQSSLLVGLLLLADRCLRERVCARFRYALWLLVLVKLMLPPSLALPTGIAYWLGGYRLAAPVVSEAPVSAPSEALGGYAEPVREIVALPPVVMQTMGPTVTRSHAASLQWSGLMLLAWIAGVLLLLALVLWRLVFVRRLLSRSRPAGGRMAALLEERRAEAGITTQVLLRLTDEVRSPAVTGFWRPVILLPARLPTALQPEGLRTVLTHELAHINRRDPWVDLARTALQAVYFWHPLVWVTNRKLRHLRELAVDETVLVALHSEAQCYTDTLINIAEMAFRKPALSLRWIGIAESKRTLERRIAHMLNQHISKRPALGWSWLLAILALGALLVPMGRARASEFAAQLPQKIASFNIDAADLKQVLATFGTPVKYIWEDKTLSADQLPNRFVMVYPGGFEVFMFDDRVVELRHEEGSTYVFAGKLRLGSTLDEALAVLGPPTKTVQGQPIDWANSANVLFKDIDGRQGHDYYHRPDLKVRVWFANDKVAAIYMTRSDYGKERTEPSDPEFARLLPERVAKLNIDTAGPKEVMAIFGTPIRYVWGDKIFQPEALPDRYIMIYPSGFRVFISGNHIVEIRHERGYPYVYRGKLRIGSTLQEALDLLGAPDQTVTGQANTFKDKVLYRDLDGEKGHDYYHRSDQKVRVWFLNDKVIAIYMTRSDYGKESASPFDPEFARLLPERVAKLDIDTAGPDQVKKIFGEPIGYVWGNQKFQANALPANYIMTYPCSFEVWVRDGRIMEIRHERGSPYVYRDKLRIGSTLQEALDLLGAPDKSVTGQKNGFENKVLYRDIDGQEGHDYYHRADQKVRVWFWDDKVIAIYMTRSDFPAK